MSMVAPGAARSMAKAVQFGPVLSEYAVLRGRLYQPGWLAVHQFLHVSVTASMTICCLLVLFGQPGQRIHKRCASPCLGTSGNSYVLYVAICNVTFALQYLLRYSALHHARTQRHGRVTPTPPHDGRASRGTRTLSALTKPGKEGRR